MKELLQSFFKTSEERIKNPFIGAFITSWIAFNWKPIIFLLFSTKSIEDKIIFIEANYSQVLYILILPLIAALFYLLILPYLNLLFDEILKFSIVKKNAALISRKKQIIQDETELAIEEIKLEEAKTEYRERNTHNELVENLQSQNKELDLLLKEEKEKATKMNSMFIEETRALENSLNSELEKQRKKVNEIREENFKLKDELLNKEEKIKIFSDEPENGNGKTKLIFENGLTLTELKNGEDVYYVDEKSKELYSQHDVNILLVNEKVDRITEFT